MKAWLVSCTYFCAIRAGINTTAHSQHGMEPSAF